MRVEVDAVISKDQKTISVSDAVIAVFDKTSDDCDSCIFRKNSACVEAPCTIKARLDGKSGSWVKP